MEKFSWKGHGAMLAANCIWGLMAPVAKIVMAGSIITPLVLTDLRVFGAMVLFWVASLFRKPEKVEPRDMVKLFAASLLAIVFNQGLYVFGVSLTSPADASIYLGLDTFSFVKVLAVLLIFTGVWLVTASKSRAQMEREKAV